MSLLLATLVSRSGEHGARRDGGRERYHIIEPAVAAIFSPFLSSRVAHAFCAENLYPTMLITLPSFATAPALDRAAARQSHLAPAAH